MIALTADRLGHRRLILLGTAISVAASGLGAFAGSVDALLVGRFFEGLGFIAVVVALPTLLLRLARPADQPDRNSNIHPVTGPLSPPFAPTRTSISDSSFWSNALSIGLELVF